MLLFFTKIVIQTNPIPKAVLLYDINIGIGDVNVILKAKKTLKFLKYYLPVIHELLLTDESWSKIPILWHLSLLFSLSGINVKICQFLKVN